ncbi:hypothetical protein KP509_09G032800 [Ceratopteris richardii]|uniref:Uncharacterized protein n=1 Tax=Ceratopteris richardii TaxID=49495 RepID=A0A8T2U389_CERRI|nr:hypothetical protein KP509_09G032800 [Ceratopteris richardii]
MALPFSGLQSWPWKSPTSPNTNTSPCTYTNTNLPVSPADSFAAFETDAYQICARPKGKKSDPYKPFRNSPMKARKERQRRKTNSVQRVDLEFDMVIVQPDYSSESDSVGSDWSVGWFEPHAPEFCSDTDSENSFAVLIPCYDSPLADEKPVLGQEHYGNPYRSACSSSQLWSTVLTNISKDRRAETNFYIQQWVSSLQTEPS